MSNPDVPFPDPIDFAEHGLLLAAAKAAEAAWREAFMSGGRDYIDDAMADLASKATRASRAACTSMDNSISAYRDVVVAAKDIAMSPYTDQDAAMDPEKCGRIKVLLSLVQRERLVAALARFRNVGGAS